MPKRSTALERETKGRSNAEIQDTVIDFDSVDVISGRPMSPRSRGQASGLARKLKSLQPNQCIFLPVLPGRKESSVASGIHSAARNAGVRTKHEKGLGSYKGQEYKGFYVYVIDPSGSMTNPEAQANGKTNGAPRQGRNGTATKRR